MENASRLLYMGDSKSNQPGGGTAPSQIGLIFFVLIGSCMITKKKPIFLCQLRSMINLRSLKKIGLIFEIGCATPPFITFYP